MLCPDSCFIVYLCLLWNNTMFKSLCELYQTKIPKTKEFGITLKGGENPDS